MLFFAISLISLGTELNPTSATGLYATNQIHIQMNVDD